MSEELLPHGSKIYISYGVKVLTCATVTFFVGKLVPFRLEENEFPLSYHIWLRKMICTSKSYGSGKFDKSSYRVKS